MRITTLGELAVDGRPVRGERLATLLRELLDARGRAVSVAALVDAVWQDAPPADATGAVQALVSRLRRTGLPVQGTTGGYRLPLDDLEVDTARAHDLAAAAAAALAAGRPDDARAAAAAARALLPAAPDVADPTTARLLSEVARTAAEAALAGGGPLDTADLRLLAARVPPDEPAAALLVRVLAAQGRDAEALALVEDLRAELADRYGADPSPVVAAAHLALLRGELRPAPADTPPTPAPGGTAPSATPARAASGTTAGVASPTDPSAGPDATTSPAAPGGTPRTAPPRSVALPASWRRATTPLLGRDDDVAAVRAALRTAPVVTLVAPGGSGKTRLAAEVARAEAEGRTVRVVELAGLRAPDEVLPAVLHAVGGADLAPSGVEVTTERRALDPVDRLRVAGQDLEGLLVLDNCEHVLDAAAQTVADLLQAAPDDVTVLATSRAPLGLVGEVVHRIDTLAEDDAVALLHARAHAARPGLAWDDAVARELCRRLDHLPLALELAAARLRSMPVADVLAGLDDRFGLLDDALRGLPERHASLWALVDWSRALLAPAEQHLLERVAVLPGPFGADAAAAVAGVDDVRRGLAALVEHSLLALDDQADGPRYRMLETVREYGEARLDAAGGRADAVHGLVAWGARLARGLLPDLVGPGQVAALHALTRDQDLLVEALRHALRTDDEPAAVEVLAALGWLWSVRGAHLEVVTWAERVLHVHDPAERLRSGAVRGHAAGRPLPPPDATATVTVLGALTSTVVEPQRLTAVALRAATRLTAERADALSPRMRALVGVLPALFTNPVPPRGAIEALVGHDDPYVRGIGLFLRGAVDENAGDGCRSEADARAAYAAFEEAGDEWLMGTAAQGVGQWASDEDDDETARWLARSADHLERVGATLDARSSRLLLDIELATTGDADALARLADAAGSEQSEPTLAAQASVGLAHVAWVGGRTAEAVAHAEAAVRAAVPELVAPPQARALFRLAAVVLHAGAAGEVAGAGAVGAEADAGVAGAQTGAGDGPSAEAGDARAAHLARARVLLAEAFDDVGATSDMPVLGTFGLACAELAAAEGDPATAVELVALGRRLGAGARMLLPRAPSPALARALGDGDAVAARERALAGATATATAARLRELTAPWVPAAAPSAAESPQTLRR
ncbi:AfsR/SARP family transcriptional regulator [Cellulomonas sp. FA1]|uniref:AfsR/SARP family transcriptional regulator n=2 Tax=Cellulomonas TaxID=1707 RepID=UPI000699F137|nr:AAA family ATPase [Cellulomonas sp. FA1]